MKEKSAWRAWLRNKKNWQVIIIPALVIIAVFIAGRLIDLHTYLETAQEWIWKLGPWGPVVFAAIYVAATLLLLPGTPFTVVAALLFGPLWGFVTMLAGTVITAVIGFFIARYLARDKVEKRLAGLDAFNELNRWIKKNKWLALSFIRIMPIFPFAINNYALGLTSISFASYILISVIVFIPMTAVLIFGAQAIYAAMVRGEISWGLLAGSTAAGMVVLSLGMIGKKTFKSGK
ncbi:MAG: TVP38/TMEM64 family protein [Desulfobulbaceae bacterium]|nr:TVP38/TMEM64 family protein [Desulfobulbaceae bacterium]